jgi:hypothetical protein
MVKKKRKRPKFHLYERKTFAIGILILLAFTFLVGFGFKTDPSSITGHLLFGDLGDFSFNIWSDDGDGGNLIFVRYIMFFIVLIAIYWAIDSFVQGKNFVKILFSGAISYLAINFIIIDEIYSIMTTYSALGVTFMVIIPFIIIILFTTKLVNSGLLSVGKIFTERAIWATYGIFLIYYLVTSERSNTALNWIILGIMLVSVGIAIFNTRFVRLVRKLGRDVRDANAKARMHEAKVAEAESAHKTELSKISEDLKSQRQLNEQLRKDLDKYNTETGLM